MHGTLIKELKNESKQKMYKLDFKIYKGVNGFTIKDIADSAHLKPEWAFDGNTEFVDTVVVSDARTHYERLVFPVYNLVNKNTGEKIQSHILNQIAGEWTMLIFGGDESSMLEPEEYFEQLYEKNKEFNNVKQ